MMEDYGLSLAPIFVKDLHAVFRFDKAHVSLLKQANTFDTDRFRYCYLLLRNFHEPLLNELRRSGHGVRVYLDVRKQIRVSVAVSLCGRATQLDSYTAPLQVGDELLVGIAGRYISILIVGGVMQRDVAGVGVKDRDDFGLRLPIGAVIHDELK